jgi:hypothetical protein
VADEGAVGEADVVRAGLAPEPDRVAVIGDGVRVTILTGVTPVVVGDGVPVGILLGLERPAEDLVEGGSASKAFT